MKKQYVTIYFSWAFSLLCIVGSLYVFGYVSSAGLVYERKLDLISLATFWSFFGFLALGMQVWEMIVLFNFLAHDINGSLQVLDHKLIIIKNGERKTHELKDLKRIEQVQGKLGRKSFTSSLSYSKLVFRKDDVIILTSFTIFNHELIKLLGSKLTPQSRERGFFELINR
jgi:hypothetical protein